MYKMKSLIASAVILALTACDGGDEEVSASANSIGTLEIVGSDFFAGEVLSVSLNDTDGIADGTVTYQWVRSDDNDEVSLSSTSSYTLTEADEGSTLQVTALYSTDSGLFKSEQVVTTEIRPTLDVSATIVKGPVDSAVCEIFEIDASGVAGTVAQASSTSDATGAVTFTDVNFTGNGLISCIGGTYTDEATGNTLTAPTLRAVVDVVEDVIDVVADVVVDGVITEAGSDNSVLAPDYIVSPLTELAVQAAGDDLTTAEAEAAIINANFGIRFDTTETSPTIIGVDTLGVDGADNADQYGAVLALFSQLDADSDSDIGTLLTELSTDLSDGEFSTDTQTTFETAQLNLETTSQIASVIAAEPDLFVAIGASVGYNNDPVAAIIEGELSGTINSSSTTPLTGAATIVDPNADEAAFVVQTDIAVDFGTFSIAADGSWTYTVDNANTTVAALQIGESVTDTVTITSIDLTTAVIDVRVAALTQVAEIQNTAGDTGEIRFNVDNLRQGKLSVSFSKDETIGSDGNAKDAYITLYGSSGSNSESLIDLRIQGDQTEADGTAIAPRFLVRNTENALYPGDVVTAPFIEEQFYDIDITWDLDAADQITLSIDGEVIGGGAFSTAAVVDSDFTSLDQWFVDGVRSIQFRFGDNGTTVPFGSYFVDNIEVYSDTAGTTKVFEDDFETYIEGETLDGVDSLYSASIYSEVATFDPSVPVGPTPAVFFGLTESINSDEVTPLTGTVAVQDINTGEAFITAETLTGTYGTLAILEDGSWTYTLDTTNATIAALIVGERETDTFTISSLDGTTADLVITITGTIVVDTGANNVAVIVDTLSTDTGELRYELGDNGPLAAGRIEVSVKRVDDSFGSTDAFITLFNENTNNDGAILDLRVRDDSFGIRNPSDVDTSAATVVLDTFMDVVITWEYPGGDLTLLPLVTVEVDGVRFTTDGFTPTNDATGGVTHVAFRLGGNSAVTPDTATLTIDDLVIYSDTVGTTVVFSDDFESFADGESLDTDNSASPYNSNTSEATVLKIEAIGGPGTSGNQFATIADTLTTDTGELRYSLGTEQTTGSVSFSFKKDDTPKTTAADSTGTKNASVILFGDSTKSDDEVVQLEIKSSTIVIDDVETTFATTFTAGTEWVDVLMEWDATNAVADSGVTVKITINGTEVETVISPKANEFAIKNIQFALGSGSDTNSGNFSVDDLIVIGADGTELLNDNFESHVVDDVLDGTDDVYHANSSEATVAAE